MKRTVIKKLNIRILLIALIISFSIIHMRATTEGENPLDLTIKVECKPNAIVDSIFTIDYIVSYNGKTSKDVKFIFDSIDNNRAKLLFFSMTKHVYNSENIGINQIKTTQTDTWTAVWKALKAGAFFSPSYKVSIHNGIKVDTLGILPICKTIKISKSDRKVIKQKEKERQETIKIGKSKDNLLAIVEVAEEEFEVGDTIHCRVYLLNKVIEPSSNIRDIAIDKSFSIKDASYEVSWLEEVNIDEIDYNDSKYQKIGFAEILIVPGKVRNIKIPPIKLYGHKEIRAYEKNKYWGNVPVVVETFKYDVHTKPIEVTLKNN